MKRPSRSHVVLIPSFNSGAMVLDTVRQARTQWNPIWVVVDGSTDGTAEQLMRMALVDEGLRLFVLPRNHGKGGAILHGLGEADRCGYSHVLTMDADGQHPSDKIPEFMAESAAHPESLILGVPIFDQNAPRLRVAGRRISNWWTNLETFGAGIRDSLFGFRVYPVRPLLKVMESSMWMRRFDFDVEAAVRLVWAGLEPRSIPAPVRYLRPEEGGVSHFHYLRDNALLTWMHLRLLIGFLKRLPRLAARNSRKQNQTKSGAGR